MHDVALQRQRIVIGIDRAGLVGADGATHQGIFDIAFLGSVPDIVLASPIDEYEMDRMLGLGLNHSAAFAIRYPRRISRRCSTRSQRKILRLEKGMF